uniref:Uncharacterized protein n=1 Tax=Rhizophora mucronata TaxID=61149 RepID=A0A2P2P0M1_RHIMU
MMTRLFCISVQILPHLVALVQHFTRLALRKLLNMSNLFVSAMQPKQHLSPLQSNLLTCSAKAFQTTWMQQTAIIF